MVCVTTYTNCDGTWIEEAEEKQTNKYLQHNYFGFIIVYLDVIVAVVVEIENTEELRVGRDVNLIGVDQSLAEQLAAVLLHLDVVEFPVGPKGTVNWANGQVLWLHVSFL